MAGLLGALTDKQFWRDVVGNVPDAARGLLAQTAGAPVDIATMLMRPFGYGTPDRDVVGSTDWIGGMLGADVDRMPFRIASMLPTDASDLAKYGAVAAAALPARVARIPGGRARMTVRNPRRSMYPDIYDNPRALVSRAQVAAEDPMLKRLFGVTRNDLYEIAGRGAREGNITEAPYKLAKNPKGAKHAADVTNPRNTQRMVDILSEARARPDLYEGMASWYVMDPAHERFVQLYGKDMAPDAYRRFNTLTGMASPGSNVLTELNRGTAANWLAQQNRFDDFIRYGGGMLPGAPSDMAAVAGHSYHRTGQGLPMLNYLERGAIDMGSAKVPSYIAASGVPTTGFQTKFPVGDAHWSRLVGLPDVRTSGKAKTLRASASVPEMYSLTPWWRDQVAAPLGLEPVPAQAVVWGAGSRATGVDSPIAAPKLELLAQQIARAADRMGVSPETARDMIFTGRAHAGFIDPTLLGLLGAAGAGAGYYFLGNEARD